MVEGDWSSVVNKGQQNNVRWMKGIENLLELDLFDYSNVKKIIDDGDVARLEFVALTREGRQAIADVDHEFKVLRNMLKDSDERRVATCVAILLKLATHSAARSALTETNLLQPLAGGSEVRIKRLESMRELLKYDDIRGNLSQGGIAEFLSSVIKSDSEAASEASRVLYGYVRYSDGREAFLNMITKESTFEWLLKNEIWHLLNVSYLLTHDTGRRIIDGDLKLPDVKNIQLLTPLKEFTGELLNDEHNADGLCRLVEHGFFERASANDAIQFLIGTIGMQPFALDVLAAFFKHPEVPGKIPESFLDRWINSLQAMVLGSNDAKQCSGLQALSICAGYSEMRKKIVEANITWRLIELFKSNDDSVRYCASLALITLDGGDPQPDIPAKEIIAWLVGTVGRLWRYRRTVKFLSEIIKNDRQKNLMPASIKDLNMLTQLPDSMSSTKIFVRPQDVRDLVVLYEPHAELHLTTDCKFFRDFLIFK
ncbi:hypothetical protein BYT27DRAFT_7180260 [Phlegmacium glaucopus]|nr:hypothetical protein BYT27DRAFT_7180260 [Phlegmacium glaucopus]